jgi:hypothetical protein
MTLATAWCRFLCEGRSSVLTAVAHSLPRSYVQRANQRSVGGATFGHEAKGMGITDE